MQVKKLCAYISFFMVTTALSSIAVNASELSLVNRDELNMAKQQLQSTSQTKEAYQRLIQEADSLLNKKNDSVTYKSITPIHGSKHDYLSISPYWWPDSSKKDGLPWIRKDGDVNPASKNEQTDSVRMAAFTYNFQVMTYAWFFSHDQKYADKAISMMRTWFIDPETKMNPNLNFAQSVPGRNDGKHSGIIDGRYFATRVIDSLVLLEKNQNWTNNDEISMKKWMKDYLNWLQTSKLGKQEKQAPNNHGTWYLLQVATIAHYLDVNDVAKEAFSLLKQKINHQIAKNATQPEELARTRSFHYSWFNLQALVNFARLGKLYNEDILHYKTDNNVTVLDALNFMAPYADDQIKWPYPSLDRISERLIPLLSVTDNINQTNKFNQIVLNAKFKLPVHQADVYQDNLYRGAILQAQRDTWLFSYPMMLDKK